MNEQKFFAEREPDWKRLNMLCDKSDASPTQLSSDELREIFTLYKKVSGDLALVRTATSNPQLTAFLNDLVGRAYGLLYRPPKRSALAAIADSIALAARTVRKRKWQLFLAMAIFFGSGLIAFLCMGHVPGTKGHFVPVGWEETVQHWRDGDMQARDLGGSVEATGFYMSNNPRVSIITGAVAASTFGVMTAQLLFSNGALLGALVHELVPVNRVGYLIVHILPHGIPELMGIFVAGAAGFTMGWALIRPGRRTRTEALRDAGKDAIVLLCTAVVLMFIAAPIEGFFSFNPNVPDAVRGFVILVSGAAWLAFWVNFGKTDEEIRPKVIRVKRAKASAPAP